MIIKQFVSLTTLVLAAGCSAGPPAVEDLGSERQDIRSGAEVTSDTSGTLYLSTGCSAILLRNRWALTSHHCLPTATSTVMTRAAQASMGTPATVDKVYDQGDPVAVTVFHFNADLLAEGSATTRGPFPLYKGPASALVGQNVLCQGFGAFTGSHIDINTGEWTDYSYDKYPNGNGKLHSALLPVTQAPSTKPANHPFPDADFATTSQVSRNAAGQIGLNGDSGSGCLTQPVNPQKAKVMGTEWFAEGHLPEDPGAYNATGIWAEHYSLPTVFRDWANGIIGSAPTLGLNAGYERTDGTSSVVYRNGSNMRELFDGNGTFFVATLTTGIVASNPAMYVRPDGYNSIVFRDTLNHVRELALAHSGSSWQLFDLTAGGGVPLAAGDPSAFTRADEVPQVVYRTANNHLNGIALENGRWAFLDLNSDAPGAPLAATDPIGFIRSDGVSAIVYTDSAGHVWELSRAIGSAHWTAANPSAAFIGSRVRPYSRSDGVTALVFRSALSGHVTELSRNTFDGASWTTFDLNRTSVSDPVGYVRGDGTNAVVYEASDRSIHELALINNSWTDFNLNTVCGINAPLADIGSISAPNAYVRADRTSAVIYRSGGHMWELSLPFGGGCWAKKDMTQEAGGVL